MKKRDLTEGDFNLMGLPKEFWGAYWSFLYDSDVKKSVFNYLQSLNEDHRVVNDGDGLYLFGPSTTGKTYVAAVCAKAFRKYEYSVMFINASQFQKYCEEGVEFEEGVTYYDRSKAVDILVLDDVGSEVPAFKGKNFVLETIDFRRDWRKILIITSKFTPGGLAQKNMLSMDEFTAKIDSFMLVVKMKAPVPNESLQEKYK